MSEWIDVNKELPDDMVLKVIVYYENDCADAVSIADAYFSINGFCVFHKDEFKPIVGVTHWQLMPEPPESK